MSDKKCCVPGCTPQDGARSALHIFPDPNKDIDRFSKWYHAIGGDIVHLENGHIYKYRRVCHKHFEPKYHLRNSRISNIAIPTLHLAEPEPSPSDRVSHSNATGTADSVMPPMPSCSKSKDVNKFAVAINLEPEPSPSDRVLHSNATGTADSVMPPMPSCSKSKDVNKFAVAINLEPEPSPSDRVSHSNATGTADSVMPPMPSCSKSKDVNKFAVAINLEPELSPSDRVSHSNATGTADSVIPPVPSCSKPKDVNKAIAKNLGENKLNKKRLPAPTKKEKILQMKLNTARIKASKLKNRVKKQLTELKSARKLATNPDMHKMLEGSTSTAKLIFRMQCRLNKRQANGRRFTLKEKIVSLSILKQSPKAYRFFRKIFVLPAPQSLTKLVQRANIQPVQVTETFLNS